jgi:hypothetical protein
MFGRMKQADSGAKKSSTATIASFHAAVCYFEA